jgi:hypothetical protein
MKFDMTDIKLYLLNASAFTISFTHIDMVLKILLLVLTIGYTAQRWYLMDKKRREDNK